MPLSEELLSLREFAVEHGPSIIFDALTEMPEALRPNEEEVRTFTVTMFQDAVGLLLQRFTEDRSALQIRTLEENPSTELLVDVDDTEPALGPDLSHQDPTSIPARTEIPQLQHETGTNAVEMPQLRDAVPNAYQTPSWNDFGNVMPTTSDFEFIDPAYLQQMDEAATHWNPLFQQAFTSDSVA